MERIVRFAASGCLLAAGVLAVELLAPQRLNSQYASPVNVMNTKTAPALIRDTDNPARARWLSSVVFPLSGTCNTVFDQPVPAGQTLVVEFITANLPMDTGAKPLLSAYVPGQAGAIEFDFPTTFAFNNGSDVYLTAQPTRMYISSTSAIEWGVCPTGGFSLGGHVAVSGYLVNN